MRKLLMTMTLLLSFSIGAQPAGVSATTAPHTSRPPSTNTEPQKAMVKGVADTNSKPLAETGDVTNGIAGGYVYVPINPYRTFDSRAYNDGYLIGGDTVYFDVLTDAANVPRIPASAVAVTYNLAVTDTSGSGFLAIYPADIYWPGNASINWMDTGTTLSNGGTVAIGYFDAPGQIEIYIGPVLPWVGTDFVLDITGYYI